MRFAPLYLCVLIAACAGDNEAVGHDAAGAGPDAAATACEVGASASLSIGPAGGRLSLCGASVTVPAGAMATPVTFGIEMVAAPTPPAEPRVLAGPAFRFTPDDVVLSGPVDVAVPHGGATGRLEIYAVVGGELFGFEACTSDAETIGQTFGSIDGFVLGALGTFVAVQDTYAYAETKDDLGNGTLTAMVGARALAFDVGPDGFALDEVYGPFVGLTVETMVPGADFEQLRVQLVVPENGPVDVIHVQWFSMIELWSLGVPGAPGTTGTSDVVVGADGRLRGDVSGTLSSGEQSIAFTATLDVVADYWRYPAERVCPGLPE